MSEAAPAPARETPAFDAGFRAALCDLFAWRRDVRLFKRTPLPAGCLDRLIELACLAPSVGLSEPWRFVIVEDTARRREVRACFESCNADALSAQGPSRSGLYAKLKLAGLDDAPCHLAVFADLTTAQGHGLGRRTMPEMIEYSAVLAIHTLWLAARAEGVGVGWVSILDPSRIAEILGVPSDWRLIGYLCIGYPAQEGDTPALQQQGWETRRRSSSVVFRR